MPRPRQRKGADARKEEKRLKREQEEREQAAQLAREKRERERKTRMDWDALPSAARRDDAGKPVDPEALPEPDPDTKAYFQKVAEQIDELSALGHGAQRERQVVLDENGEEVEEELEDERPLLLRSALQSLSGHEVTLAGDGETSVVLERLLYAMDDFAKRVLLDRFTGQIERLVRHRSASHVLQTLFELAGETVDRETRGNVASAPSASTDAAELPTMTSLLLSLVIELLPTLSTLIYDPFASHCIRILLLVFSGVPCSSSSSSSSSSRGERSKKSAQFRKNQGSLGKNWLADDFADDKGKGKSPARLATPPEFAQALKDFHAALDQLDTDAEAAQGASNVPGEGVRRAAIHEVAGPVMRILIELEASSSSGGWKSGGWADRVLCGLVGEVQDSTASSEKATELREEYLAGLLRHPASSPTFETVLSLAPHPVFSALWTSFFAGKMHRLAGNAVANYVVAVGIGRVDEAQMEELVKEVKGVASERRGEWIDNYRTGVLRSMLERATRLERCEKEMSEIMLDTFGLATGEDRKLVIPCVLTLNRLQHWKKLAAGATPEPSTQGSVLLQTWLKLHAPHQQPVFDSIAALSLDSLLALTRSTISSHVLDALLTSPTTPPRALRTFLLSLIGHYPTLAADRIGSRVAERCFATADVYLKDKIAASLAEDPRTMMDLQKSAYGHFFARKVDLPLWMRRRDDWKAKMARLAQEEKAKVAAEAGAQEDKARVAAEGGAQAQGQAIGANGANGAGEGEGKKRKKRERKADEVDEIFSQAAKRTKSGAHEDQDERERPVKIVKPKKTRAEELGEVLAAIKESL
ncbi:hypothetical protein JCM21900_000464 [Sporobolomyces salmonicolor]